jgi:hypothetical protein
MVSTSSSSIPNKLMLCIGAMHPVMYISVNSILRSSSLLLHQVLLIAPFDQDQNFNKMLAGEISSMLFTQTQLPFPFLGGAGILLPPGHPLMVREMQGIADFFRCCVNIFCNFI